jgi:hypothetical protein
MRTFMAAWEFVEDGDRNRNSLSGRGFPDRILKFGFGRGGGVRVQFDCGERYLAQCSNSMHGRAS